MNKEDGYEQLLRRGHFRQNKHVKLVAGGHAAASHEFDMLEVEGTQTKTERQERTWFTCERWRVLVVWNCWNMKYKAKSGKR